jgi:hypothetical protein
MTTADALSGDANGRGRSHQDSGVNHTWRLAVAVSELLKAVREHAKARHRMSFAWIAEHTVRDDAKQQPNSPSRGQQPSPTSPSPER